MDTYLTTTLCIACLVCLSPLVLYLLGFQRDPFHPLIFIGTLTFFVMTYFPLRYQPLVLDYLPGEVYARFELLVAAVMAAIFLGWFFSSWRRKRSLNRGFEETIRPIDVASYNPTTLFVCGAILISIAIPLFFLTYENWQVTAYARDLGLMWLPGAMLMVQVMVMDKRLRMGAIIFLLIAVIPPLNRFMVYGQRADTIRLALLGVVFYMTVGKRPSRPMFIGATIFVGIILTSLTTTRYMVESGGARNRIDALLKVGPAYFTTAPTHLNFGEEFLYGSICTEHARVANDWGYGAAVTYVPVIHTLPKEWFPWKSDYFYMHGNYDWQELRGMFGILISSGSAPTGIADLYIDLWWFSLIIWFLFGYGLHRIHLRAMISGNIRSQGILTGMMVGLMYLITQEIYQGYTQLIYATVPIAIVYKMARLKTADAEARSPLTSILNTLDGVNPDGQGALQRQ